MEENHMKYVCSRGILKSCDIHSTNPVSSTGFVDNTYQFSDMKEGATIYICTTAFRDFITRVLPDIRKPFILVTGDCDIGVPHDIFIDESSFLGFLDRPILIHWYSQNCIYPGSHPKLTRIPIGLDYHTLKNGFWWGPPISVADQEIELDKIREEAVPLQYREIKCYGNFHFSMGTRFAYDRHDALKQIPKELMAYEPQATTRENSWRNQIKYAFTISPHGGGYDCHRTWETLCLGSIPIVKKSLLDPLYEGLPVLIVDQWTDITQELLDKTLKEYTNINRKKKFQYEKLTLKYWVDKIQKGES
jgi:hypothetical protein